MNFKLYILFYFIFKTLASQSSQSSQVDYTGYKVLRVFIDDVGQLEFINQIEQEFMSTVTRLATLRKTKEFKMAVDLQISPNRNSYDQIIDILRYRRIRYQPKIDNLQRLIEKERRSMEDHKLSSRRKRQVEDFSKLIGTESMDARYGRFFENSIGTFLTHREILDWLSSLTEIKPNLITLIEIGWSFENRSIIVAKITNGIDDGSKPVLWIDAGIHGREWLSVSTAVFLINMLVLTNDKDVSFLLNNFVLLIAPVINPDGYDYAHTTDRMWRKTRSVSKVRSKRGCMGVDANRNFDFKWRDCHFLSTPDCWRQARSLCADSYPGTKPFSEPETRAVADHISAEKHRLKLYLSFHAYSQVWLLPWGYTNAPPADIKDLNKVSKSAVQSIINVNNISFEIGNPCDTIGYLASGGSYDWAKGSAGVKYSFTAELRDRGEYGFVPPTTEILPTGKEMWAGFVALVTSINEDTCWMEGQGCDDSN